MERARLLSLQTFDSKARAKKMQEAFLRKYGSFFELAKMGMQAPKRKPSKLELRVARMLGKDWEYVGGGRLDIGGLVPDFIHVSRRQVLEVLGCYYHSCPIHFPEAPMRHKASPEFRKSVYEANGYGVILLWEHDVKGRKLAFRDAGVDDPSVYAV